ncbi:MAG: hypothetical protein ACSHX0_00470 [Akkermansiaceae bacterium]
MAKKQQIALRKQELVSHLASSRLIIRNGKNTIQSGLSPKKNLQSLFSKPLFKKPQIKVAGSVLLGLLVSLLLKRRRKFFSKKSKSKKFILLGWAISLLKPTLKSLLMKQVKAQISKQIAARSSRPAAQTAVKLPVQTVYKEDSIFKISSEAENQTFPKGSLPHVSRG